jgi:hypothetical protein
MPMRTPSDPLHDRLLAWTWQTKEAASRLLGLYTQLGDTRQRLRTLRILDAATARLAQCALSRDPNPVAAPIQPEDTDAELRAWQSALEASTEILVFLTLALDTEGPTFGLRGQLSHFTRASQAALQGLHCAFPQGLALECTQQSILQVLEACRSAFKEAFPEDINSEGIESLLGSIHEGLQSHLVDFTG